MDFKQYLRSKRIDAQKFSSQKNEKFIAWEKDFDQMNPESFTNQKKFLINGVRRDFLLENVVEEVKEIKNTAPKPIIKPAGGNTPKPVMKPIITSSGAKPIIKPKIGGGGTASVPKLVLKPKIPAAKSDDAKPALKPVMKPVIKKADEEQVEKPKVSALKPKIPGKKS